MTIAQSIVVRAVHEIREPSGDQSTIDALSSIPSADLLEEIAMWVEDVTAGMNVPKLIESATLPLPEDAQKIVDVVDRRGAAGLSAYEGNDPEKLVRMIAALQEAGENH